MDTAMAFQNWLANMGMRPKMVVKAASMMGLKRTMADSTMAARSSMPLSRCCWIWSTMTMLLRMMVPVRARMPSSAMKPRGELKSNRPRMTPMMPMGAVSMMTRSLRTSCSCSMMRIMMSTSIKGTGLSR